MDTTDKIFLHQIAAPGLPGGITEAEAAAIRAELGGSLMRVYGHMVIYGIYPPERRGVVGPTPGMARTEVDCDMQNHSLTQSQSVNLDTPFRERGA